MGKKSKVGKQRKDKYYQLAKETGYRSRSAFKLIQLNRKYEFLHKSRVLVDLCAAPGGWLQVATQHMPVASVVIGVDLVPIRPIPNVITIEGDITKNTCKQALKKQLQTWKADVVLHDGAPNVGKNWLHDAFQQAQLTLQAFKLATEFLMKGGWFVTKIFRSKDYHPLLWVFKQFFKKVFATKPQASRTESAEIFVVCQYYVAPDKIDPKLLDTKYVFDEVDPEPKIKLNLLQKEKKKKKAEGYEDGATLLFKSNTITTFITNTNYLELLTDTNQLIFDDPKMADHILTTDEIKECCKDIKVLGRKEIKSLLSWRKKMRDEFFPEEKAKNDVTNELTQEDLEEDEDSRIQREIEELKMQEMREIKRKRKKVFKVKKQLNEKMNLKMVIRDDEPIRDEDVELFKLGQMKSRNELNQVEKGDSSLVDDELKRKDEMDDEAEPETRKKVRFYLKDDKHLAGYYSDGTGSDSDHDILHTGSDDETPGSDDDDIETATEGNPLMVDLETGSNEAKRKRKMDFWFDKESFEGLEKEEDEDLEMEEITNYYKGKGKLTTKSDQNEAEMDTSGFESDETDGSGETDDTEKMATGKGIVGKSEKSKKKKRKELDVEGLALGSLLIQSKKRKRDLIDNGWNRYTFGDEDAPDWFKEDEEKHNKKQIPVTKEMMTEFRDRLKEINARPIAKIAEAKARKKKRTLKKMEKARKRAEVVTEAIDMTDQEKVQQLKTIYKKAGIDGKKKKEVTYVVSRKAFAAKRPSRPAGLKGPYKIVDPRMKKDDRKNKINTKKGAKRSAKKNKR